ncbi:MAG: hypothetical protein K0S71_2621 [Clostridia bacterium]|nr:hypothetical protein [Clostridia bacterium]
MFSVGALQIEQKVIPPPEFSKVKILKHLKLGTILDLFFYIATHVFILISPILLTSTIWYIIDILFKIILILPKLQ